MPAFIDLTGREVGKWRVLRRDPAKVGAGAWWVCECAPDLGGCGREKSIQGGSLRRAESTQCRACSGKGNTNKLGKSPPAETGAKISAALRGRAKKKVERTCAGCGEVYLGAPHSMYCSPECRPPRRVPTGTPMGRPRTRSIKLEGVDRRRGPRPPKYPERDARIVALRAAGKKLQEIGDALGITKERVRQILARTNTTRGA